MLSNSRKSLANDEPSLFQRLLKSDTVIILFQNSFSNILLSLDFSDCNCKKSKNGVSVTVNDYSFETLIKNKSQEQNVLKIVDEILEGVQRNFKNNKTRNNLKYTTYINGGLKFNDYFKECLSANYLVEEDIPNHKKIILNSILTMSAFIEGYSAISDSNPDLYRENYFYYRNMLRCGLN